MIHDQQLKSDVENELRWEPSLRSEQIGVSVKDGVVELDGHVESYFEKWSAERAAMRVHNAKSVASEIRVEMPNSFSRTDSDIAKAAMHQLEWNYMVPETVKVQVTDGCVTLKGTTEWQYQKDEAERLVRPLRGVKWFFSEITVTPKLTAGDVKKSIEEALKRSAIVEASHIKVETAGGQVTLRGYVHSWAEREEAQHAAWAAPGVTMVDDLITIS
jgi:osmotically-inducible protein OsmY